MLYKQTNKRSNKNIHKQTNDQTKTNTNKQTIKQKQTKTNKQTNKQINKHIPYDKKLLMCVHHLFVSIFINFIFINEFD